MSLRLCVRSHPDALVGVLADQLAAPPADPFSVEVVAVPTRGIERWLTQRIASELAMRRVGDGICANVSFPSPRRLVATVLASVPGLDASAEAWAEPRVVGHLLHLMDDHRDEEWLWLLKRYLDGRGAVSTGRRITAARKIARLFGRYARRRPEMIRSWAAGEDVGADGAAIDAPAAWQPRLWRLVREATGVASIPELLPDALDPVRRGAVTLDLPPRVGVYGLTAVDPLDLEVLGAVGGSHEVFLYVLHPSPALWRETAEANGFGPGPRHAAAAIDRSRHPLLQSWARESRELQQVLHRAGHVALDVATDGPEVSSTLLGRLQDDIRHNRPPAASATLVADVVDGIDRSIQIHVCHGARRQVEVARDAILHILKSDPTLQPRDVVIMTPDLATFGPLLEAAFPEATTGVAGDNALPDLRVRIADRAPAATNPLVRFAATVLQLATARLDAGTVRELIAEPAVRRRFDIDEERAGLLNELIDDANVRWGLDADHRAEWGAGQVADQTWRRALDRALTGVYLSDSPTRVVGNVAPLAGIEGGEAAIAGLLAQIVDRIAAVRTLLSGSRPRRVWAETIARSVQLLAAPGWEDEWQWAQLSRLLERTFGVDDDEAGPLVSTAEAAVLISDWTQDHPSPLHFRTGDVTVCTLVPMRSVPYRVVCLIGMDDERFPRSGETDGDDLLAYHEVVGDPDRSAEDRQLLLDAVMAAGDFLLFTYSGRDELTNAKYPPAVPVAELDDVLRTMVGDAGLCRLTTRHPLQAFGKENFIPGRLGVVGPWSFDPMQLDGALAAGGEPVLPTAPGAAAPGGLPVEDPIALSDLIRFLSHPAQWHLRNHQQLTIPRASEAADDTLEVDVDALGAWSLRDQVLRGLRAGGELDSIASHLKASDALPPGRLGDDDLETAVTQASQLWELAAQNGYAPQRNRLISGDVVVAGVVVRGRVEADPESAQLTEVSASRLGPKPRIAAACQLAFITCLEPERSWRAVLIGRAERGNGRSLVTMGPTGSSPESRLAGATELLAGLLSIYLDAHRQRVPLPPKTAYAWQRGMARGAGQARRRAAEAWERDRFAPESSDPANAMVFDDLRSVERLLASDFPEYARKLWLPILTLCGEKTA